LLAKTESLVLQRQAAKSTFAYHATIPGAPWPLETVAMTTDSGTITTVIYRAVLKLPSVAEVSFKKSIGLLSDKLEIEGPDAERFRNRKALLKKIKDGLNRRYEPPAWGRGLQEILRSALVRTEGYCIGSERH
jgi:hypothetical protein